MSNTIWIIDCQVLSKSPEILTNTFLENRGTTPQSTTRVITYSVSESHSWSETVGVAVGVEISITTGVPLLAVSHAQFALLYNTINKSEHNACVAVTGRNQIKHYS